jgi:hypothetical protein
MRGHVGPLAVLLAVAAPLGACGAPSKDLFVVTRSGSIPGARLSLIVNDGSTVRCNGGATRKLGSENLLQARALERDLEPLAKQGRHLAPGPAAVLRYRVRLEEGTVAFADDSRPQPVPFLRIQAFTRRVAQRVCGLAR